MKLADLVYKVRSKNAGPFWITIDIFCGTEAAYKTVCRDLSHASIAKLLQIEASELKHFLLPELKVIKFSFPRSDPQGGRFDRDMHAAQLGVLVSEMQINPAKHATTD